MEKISKLLFCLMLVLGISFSAPLVASDDIDDDNDTQDIALQSGLMCDAVKDGTFYFVRHGITDWSMEMVNLGPQDLDLNQSGRSHIEALSEYFLPLKETPDFPEIIFSSSLKRCIQTSRIFCEKLEIESIDSLPDLREVYRGDWSKLIEEQRKQAVTFLWEKNFEELESLVKDAEKWVDFCNRIDSTISGILTDCKKCSIIVTHGQFIKTFLKQRGCWRESWIAEKRWTGNERPPIKVTIKNKAWVAEIMEQ